MLLLSIGIVYFAAKLLANVAEIVRIILSYIKQSK
jgi:hypothetical protein